MKFSLTALASFIVLLLSPYASCYDSRSFSKQLFNSQMLKVSFISNTQPDVQGVGIPLDFSYKDSRTGLTVFVENNKLQSASKKYTLNWYLKQKITQKFGANINLYGERYQNQTALSYSNVNAGMTYQLNPTWGFNVSTFTPIVGGPIMLSNFIGTTISF